MIVLLFLLGCGEDGRSSSEAEDVLASSYLSLEDGDSWVYRDDGDTGLFDEDELLRAQHLGDGVVELRRGRRWADAETVGELVWDVSSGLSLLKWALPSSASGEGDYPLAGVVLLSGLTVQSGDWSCLSSQTEGEVTWYGTFEDVFVFECEGGGGLEGRYVFANGIGLVELQTEQDHLELVAPW